MKSFSMNQDFSFMIFNFDAHFAKTGDGGKAVSSFQKMGDLSGSLGKGTKHDGTMGDGFIPRYGDFAVEIGKFFNFHSN